MVTARGRVVVLNTPRKLSFVAAPGVLVEVFDHPELVREEINHLGRGEPVRARQDLEQQRIAVCVTGDNGRFDFKLRPGTYELRFSKSGGIETTSVLIETSPRGERKSLIVHMEVAT
jgi:hypothetical protein